MLKVFCVGAMRSYGHGTISEFDGIIIAESKEEAFEMLKKSPEGAEFCEEDIKAIHSLSIEEIDINQKIVHILSYRS